METTARRHYPLDASAMRYAIFKLPLARASGFNTSHSVKIAGMRQPSGFHEVVELIGEAEALCLVQQHGGTTLAMPSRYDVSNPHGIGAQLAALIGAEAAQRLVFTYASMKLSVPRMAAHERHHRDARLQRRFDEMTGSGTSARKAVTRLAREFNIVESTVWRALKRPT